MILEQETGEDAKQAVGDGRHGAENRAFKLLARQIKPIQIMSKVPPGNSERRSADPRNRHKRHQRPIANQQPGANRDQGAQFSEADN